jgi:hypothetical protein
MDKKEVPTTGDIFRLAQTKPQRGRAGTALGDGDHDVFVEQAYLHQAPAGYPIFKFVFTDDSGKHGRLNIPLDTPGQAQKFVAAIKALGVSEEVIAANTPITELAEQVLNRRATLRITTAPRPNGKGTRRDLEVLPAADPRSLYPIAPVE